MEKEAVSVNNLESWSEYFASIVSVCPWSYGYWKAQKIDIVKWTGEKNIKPLGEYVARIHIHKNASGRILCNIHHRLNKQRPHEEWLYSAPEYKGYSTPVPVLIQQDLETLTKARKQNGDMAHNKSSNYNN